MLRILVIADDLLARTGLTTLLETETDCDIVGQISGGPNLAEDLPIYAPDIILYDLGWSPSKALPYIAPLVDSALPIAALLPNEDDANAVLGTLIQFESYGLLLRERDPETLVSALFAISNGLIVLDPAFALDAISISSAPLASLPEPLTSREDEVLQLLAKGMTNKAIALDLGITDHTVKFHVNAIMSKLGAQSRTEAVVQATRAGLIVL
ncbi:response regulator transcription factor [Phototrophicus methaneseepsis]|uniref:Response regulator transcription factor n=1 Tax=Phototrophicus methaneseepsis TaxID=2710758 RepID=A0A7S8IGG2_9CHLR|nr:response regulator transcription factor [Phototrophicus methaneseepsis]QPC84736.1 response regulator transcription factor [Phototrophicus methaneseepsis]